MKLYIFDIKKALAQHNNRLNSDSQVYVSIICNLYCSLIWRVDIKFKNMSIPLRHLHLQIMHIHT